MAFPRSSEIFKGDMRDVRDTIARSSLDTYYQVNFSFGNFDKWLAEVDDADALILKKELRQEDLNEKCLCYVHKQRFQAQVLWSPL